MADRFQPVRRVYLLCGLSFVGKTTFARTLARIRRAEVVSLDDINEKRGLPFGGEGLPEEAWAETLRLALVQLDDLMTSGTEIVVDDTCCFRWLRDEYRRLAERHRYESVVIRFDVSLETIQ